MSSLSTAGLSAFASFTRHFTVGMAYTHAQLDAAHHLRHRVYCVENPYEPRTPDERETDRFDEHAVHTVLIHRKSGRLVGCARLILPHENGMPFDDVCAQTDRPPDAVLPRNSTAELSRLSISRGVRQELADVDPETQAYLLPALLGGVVAVSEFYGITHWCYTLDPRLIERLTSISLYVQPLGALVDYHGLRQPAYNSVQVMRDDVRAEREDIWSLFTQDGRFDRAVAA